MSDKVRSESASEDRAQTDADVEVEPEIEVEVDSPEVDIEGADVTDEPASDIARLEAEKAQLEHEKKDYWDRLLRTTADLDNFRKRAKRDVDEARIDARGRVLKEMLPVIDNLERALDHAESGAEGNGKDVTGIIEGIKLVMRQFGQALERCDVTPVATEGSFDPNVHEAIGQIETADQPPGSIVQVMQRGYRIGERLLRPALVVVAKAPPEPPASGSNGSHPPAEGESEGDAES